MTTLAESKGTTSPVASVITGVESSRTVRSGRRKGELSVYVWGCYGGADGVIRKGRYRDRTGSWSEDMNLPDMSLTAEERPCGTAVTMERKRRMETMVNRIFADLVLELEIGFGKEST